MGKFKQTSFGCLGIFGVLLGLAGLLILVLSIFGMFASEQELDKKRDQYAAYEQELEEYEADSLKVARYGEILLQMDEANENGDSLLMSELQDSLAYYAPPEQRGVIGFNIAAAFLMIPAATGVALMVIGLVIAVVFYYLWERSRRKSRIDSV